jgi:hypothetical protein
MKFNLSEHSFHFRETHFHFSYFQISINPKYKYENKKGWSDFIIYLMEAFKYLETILLRKLLIWWLLQANEAISSLNDILT